MLFMLIVISFCLLILRQFLYLPKRFWLRWICPSLLHICYPLKRLSLLFKLLPHYQCILKFLSPPHLLQLWWLGTLSYLAYMRSRWFPSVQGWLHIDHSTVMVLHKTLYLFLTSHTSSVILKCHISCLRLYELFSTLLD